MGLLKLFLLKGCYFRSHHGHRASYSFTALTMRRQSRRFFLYLQFSFKAGSVVNQGLSYSTVCTGAGHNIMNHLCNVMQSCTRALQQLLPENLLNCKLFIVLCPHQLHAEHIIQSNINTRKKLPVSSSHTVSKKVSL